MVRIIRLLLLLPSLGGLASITQSATGYQFPGATKYVSGITIADTTGVVTAVSIVPNAGGNIVLTPTEVTAGTGQLRWVCSSNIAPKYLPTECRPT